jgi:L-threonylcarbamoyladenylate synthase
MMEKLVEVNEIAEKIYENFLPGPVTMLLEQKEPLPSYVTSENNIVAIRVPSHPVALKIIENVGPITTTSANLHGLTEPKEMNEALRQLGDKVQLYIDCGRGEYNGPSTIVDCTKSSINIIREGVISHKDLIALIANK